MDLEPRLERLERQNQQLKRMVIGAVVLAGLAVAFGQAAPGETRTLKAARFVVLDDAGRQRAALGLEDGAPSLVLADSAGKVVLRCEVPAVPDKPALYLVDPQGAASVELALTMNGPVLHFADKTGTRVRLATNELNAPLAAIYDGEGRTLFEVTSNKGGSGN